MESSLEFKDTLAPIYEYRHHDGVGGCAIGGLFLEELSIYLLGDYFGQIRLLKEQNDSKWREIYFQKTPHYIWSFGYDKRNNNLYMSTPEMIYKLQIAGEKTHDFPKVVLCRTTMPDGSKNKSGC